MHKGDISQGTLWLSERIPPTVGILCYTHLLKSSQGASSVYNFKWITRDIPCIYLAPDSNILPCDTLLGTYGVTFVDELDTRNRTAVKH